jgi:hypothetical protein
MGKVNPTYIRTGLAVVALGVTYFTAQYLLPRTLVTLTKAAPATVISLADSRIIGEKILATADGKDKCVINVFVLDKSGKGVGGKSVTLEGAKNIVDKSPITDDDGKASFIVTSDDEGQFVLTGYVEGTPIQNQIRVTFRN